MKNKLSARSVAVIGGGPAGLMAAEVLIQGGVRVDLYDAMPSVGRKFLMAGKGGMNITHSEPMEPFLSRYGARRDQIKPLLDAFGPDALREWVHGLGITTFVGTSGRVFPTDMKAAPLLRAWLHRLRETGVHFHMRHRWCGWNENGSLRFVTPQGEHTANADAVVLAQGGGSWARLGSDGAWVPLLERRGISVMPLRPANCGFDVGWSEHFSSRFAGHPVKTVTVTFIDTAGEIHRRQGDLMVTATGIEGGLIYALSARLRDEIAATGAAVIYLDLTPGKDLPRIITEIAHPRGSRSMASHLQSRANIKGVKTGLLRERVPPSDFANPERLAASIKSLPLRLIAPRPLNEAISSAGGVAFKALDECLMVRTMPGVFCAGEMLDWEAPTGGYLLTACFASGRAAGLGVLAHLECGNI
ncbi:TIGR03862 family flavoprotein [Candidatus Nitrotoga sp. AM1P]|uniref:TIGR03862 family flavoprotein n=1 Tax=Candidatus Nitrotoga sp. AM1P TaxID=2559597 RepID=UPI0010BBA2D1|nr:TIGR03862 family flavoprotein [Candidatus Nitrotoga sp. AM1P]BBJ24562.1 NAD(FAD)-utilizing dehydrogenase [Candidatus Nitrotoga sp. AM1P]